MLESGRAETLEAGGAEARGARDLAPQRVRLVGLDRRPSVARTAPTSVPNPTPRPARRLDGAERIAAIEGALAALRPRLKADGGDCSSSTSSTTSSGCGSPVPASAVSWPR